jgi:hypothetical protein
MQPPLRDRDIYIVDCAGHVRQRTLLLTSVAGFGREFGEKCDLEVVKVFVVPRKFPVSAVLQDCFYHKPIFVFSETVSGNAS